MALYTGNDDHIVADLVTRHPSPGSGRGIGCVGGLLGQWAVWTTRAVETLGQCHSAVRSGRVPGALLSTGAQLTEANAAIFDVRHGFRGSIPGVHEVLRRQGLLRGNWCLDRSLTLSRGQREAIDRVSRSYPRLTDDRFVRGGLDEWLR